MDAIATLAEDTHRRWRRAGGRDEAFAESATAALEHAALHEQLTLDSALHLGLSRIAQVSESARHNSPEVVFLHRDRDLSITLHCWNNRLAQSHCHTWNGAFQVLTGPILHAWDHFEVDIEEQSRERVPAQRRPVARVLWGRRTQTSLRQLHPGDIVTVQRRDTIHALCHLHAPSLSIAIRGTDNRGGTYEFWGAGLALQVDTAHGPSVGRERLLRALLQTDQAAFETALAHLLRQLDVEAGVLLANQVVDLFPGRADEFATFLRRAVAHWGERIDTVLDGIVEMRRHRSLQNLLSDAKEVESRRLVAGLRLAHTRSELLRLFADEQADGRDTSLGRALTELAHRRASDLFHEDLADIAVEVLLILARASSPDYLSYLHEQLSASYDAESLAENLAEINEIAATIRAMPAFQTLWSGLDGVKS